METDTNQYLRYLGVLGLLGYCSEYVDDETRELIEIAFTNAALHDKDISIKVSGKRFWIEIKQKDE